MTSMETYPLALAMNITHTGTARRTGLLTVFIATDDGLEDIFGASPKTFWNQAEVQVTYQKCSEPSYTSAECWTNLGGLYNKGPQHAK